MPAISVQKPAAVDCEPEASLYQRESGHLKTTTKYYMAGEMTAVSSAYCSYSRPGFAAQHAQLPVTPFQGIPHALASKGTYTHEVHTNSCRHTHVH